MERALFLIALGGSSLVFSMVLLGLLIPKLDREITSLSKTLKEYERKREYLLQDQRGYQVWDSKGIGVRDTITILEVLNRIIKSPNIERVIEERQKILETIMVHMLIVISQKLDYTENDFKIWRTYDYEELDSQKLKCFNRYTKIFGETLVSINSVEALIRVKEEDRKKEMYATTFFQVFGTFLTILSQM